jgi:hypothetical protein
VIYCPEEADQAIALYAHSNNNNNYQGNNNQQKRKLTEDKFYVYGRDSDFLAMMAPYVGEDTDEDGMMIMILMRRGRMMMIM